MLLGDNITKGYVKETNADGIPTNGGDYEK